ncbi:MULTISPECIES: DUF4279 domain-containing protein [unclassified Microbacterium]|uniref:DUF4279 domain-containing protein n=1 Tax=unclassified Microbacterium TaxID=2609290 RepID=UPI00341BF79E
MTVREISALLGLEPTRSGDKGDLTPAGRAGRNLAPEYLRYPRAFWSLGAIDREPSAEDRTGFSALRELVEILAPVADALAVLREGGETIIWWSGDSDSTQGGFVLEADLITRLAALGCHVYGTAFLSEDADDADG